MLSQIVHGLIVCAPPDGLDESISGRRDLPVCVVPGVDAVRLSKVVSEFHAVQLPQQRDGPTGGDAPKPPTRPERTAEGQGDEAGDWGEGASRDRFPFAAWRGMRVGYVGWVRWDKSRLIAYRAIKSRLSGEG